MKELIVFILSGGFGTRLRRVVSDVPKPMAPILDKPFLEYQVELIRDYLPFAKIYLLTYYKSEIIENHFKGDKNIEILKEDEPLGTGGSIKNAIDKLKISKDEKLLIFNGDTYVKPDLEEFLKNESPVAILGSYQEKCDRYGTLSIENDYVVDFNEKDKDAKNSYINAGCYLFNELKFFEKIGDKVFSIEDKFKEYLLKNRISLFRYNDVFIDTFPEGIGLNFFSK